MPPAAPKKLAELLGQENKFKWNQSIDQQIISHMGLPIPIIDRHQACDPPPDLNVMDAYREDDLISMKIYTDPDFALVQWMKEQREMIEKKKAERKARRERKRNENGVRGNQGRRGSFQKRQVATVSKKLLSGRGAEFDGPAQQSAHERSPLRQQQNSQEESQPRGEGRAGAGEAGPVKPRQHRFDVACLDGSTTPNAQTSRRVAIRPDVQRNAFNLKPLCYGFGKGCTVGDARIGEFQTDRCVRPCRRIDRKIVNPVACGTEIPDRLRIGIGAHFQRVQTAD